MATEHYKDDKDQRLYHIEGLNAEYPSCTTILGILDKSGPLMGWATKTMAEYLMTLADSKGHIVITKDEAMDVFKKAKGWYKELSQKAKDFGSALHNLIEVYLKKQPVDGLLEELPSLKKPFADFKKWEKENNLKVLENEHIIWSEKYRYAGTLDLVATLNGGKKLYIVDLKSSKAIYPEYLMQIAAYRAAYEERSGKKIDGVGILRLPKVENDTIEWREYTLAEADKAFKAFLHLVDYWWETNGGGR